MGNFTQWRLTLQHHHDNYETSQRTTVGHYHQQHRSVPDGETSMGTKQSFSRSAQRSNTPLFESSPGVGVQSSHIRTMWYHMIRTPSVTATLPHGHAAKYSFHSLRKMYATGLSRAGASRPRIQSMCRWLSEEAVDLYDKLDHETHISYVDAAYQHSPDIITPALLRTLAATKIDDNEVYEDWCKACHIDLSKQMALDWS